MAKWGEGDPRWLVEERPDAKNVNNWHWTEKNAANWSKDKLKSILVGTKVETDFAKCSIIEITKCDGDAVVNNRKGRLIVFYEWAIEMKWTGELINGDTQVKGTVEIPNLSEEHDMKDVDINVLLETNGPEADILKDMMRKTGGEVIRRQLSLYVTSLKEEFSKGLILPTKDSLPAANSSNSLSTSQPRSEKDQTKVNEELENRSKIDTTEYKSTEIFKCTAEEFYRALTVLDLVQSFTQGACHLDASPSGKFSLFDGNVTGSFVKFTENELVVQKWRFSSWPENHHSEVRLDIKQKSDCTEVTISHKGIPKGELENTRNGWKRFYWDSLRRNLGFGALLF